jgi:DNA (cytosine-5)-methyltransferase 1
MAEALGWGAARVVNTRGARSTPGGNEFEADSPSWALTEKARSWTVRSSFGEPARGTHERDPFSEPAHTLTEKARSWVLRNGNQPNATERGTDEPAPTMAFGHNARFVQWMLRNNTQANSSTRTLDEPAGTLFFGARGNDVSWVAERPATTLATTDRVAKPGHRDRASGERQFEDAVRISVEEASVLQSFQPDYPWQGSKTKKFLQIGNAVPPLLALHVLASATGIGLPIASQPALTHA